MLNENKLTYVVRRLFRQRIGFIDSGEWELDLSERPVCSAPLEKVKNILLLLQKKPHEATFSDNFVMRRLRDLELLRRPDSRSAVQGSSQSSLVMPAGRRF